MPFCKPSFSFAYLIVAGLLSLVSTIASSAQVLQGRPDDTLSASISRMEPTLIRIEGRKIRNIFGEEKAFFAVPDKEAGTVYITPGDETRKTVTLFVTDDAGKTWKLLLIVTDGPADSIVIKGQGSAAPVARPGKEMARTQAIKRVVLALESDRDGDTDARQLDQIVPLWSEVLFVLVKEVDGALKGQRYLLTNISKAEMVIDERELYRRGVVAVSVEQPVLSPGVSTNVYIASESGQ